MATRNYDAERSDYMTPPGMYNPILGFLGIEQFDIDVCCTKHNIPAARHFTKETNGLIQPWQGKCFMNPEFNKAPAWVLKAVSEVILNGCEVWAVLPIDRFYVNYYQDLILNNHDCAFGILRGKQGFIIPGKEDEEPVPSVGIMIACFSRRAAEVEYAWNHPRERLFGVKAFIGGHSS